MCFGFCFAVLHFGAVTDICYLYLHHCVFVLAICICLVIFVFAIILFFVLLVLVAVADICYLSTCLSMTPVPSHSSSIDLPFYTTRERTLVKFDVPMKVKKKFSKIISPTTTKDCKKSPLSKLRRCIGGGHSQCNTIIQAKPKIASQFNTKLANISKFGNGIFFGVKKRVL